jgi:hypothetical protein
MTGVNARKWRRTRGSQCREHLLLSLLVLCIGQFWILARKLNLYTCVEVGEPSLSIHGCEVNRACVFPREGASDLHLRYGVVLPFLNSILYIWISQQFKYKTSQRMVAKSCNTVTITSPVGISLLSRLWKETKQGILPLHLNPFLQFFFPACNGVDPLGVLFLGNKIRINRCHLTVRCHAFGALSFRWNSKAIQIPVSQV